VRAHGTESVPLVVTEHGVLWLAHEIRTVVRASCP
jgi:hypothetical protein